MLHRWKKKKRKRWQHVYFWMNCLFKVYLIKRHTLYHVLESLYLWESLEDKENNHSDIRYRFILLWKRYRDGGTGLCVRTHETEDTVCSGFSPDEKKLMRSLQQKHTHPHIFISFSCQFSFSFLLISAWILSYRISDDYWQKSNKLMLIKMMFVDKTWWNKIRNDN